jgi:hypothetical protein
LPLLSLAGCGKEVISEEIKDKSEERRKKVRSEK